jgi:hypothetical protein
MKTRGKTIRWSISEKVYELYSKKKENIHRENKNNGL